MRYPKALHVALLMDNAKFYYQTMIQPYDKAKIIQKNASKNIACEIYLGKIDKDIDSDSWIEVTETIKDFTFNNPQRVRKYLDYNLALSGGVYGSSPKDWSRDACSPEVIKELEEMGL